LSVRNLSFACSRYARREKRTEEGLVCSATTSDDTDHATGVAADDLLGARGKLDAGLALIGVVSDNGDVVARCATESTTVTDLLLDVGDDGSLRNGAEGEDVSDGESGVLSSVDELSSVHALVGDEGLGLLLELVGGVEDDAGERSTTTGVVDDLLHDTTDISVTLGEVEVSELGRSLPQASVRREDAAATLTLVTDLELSEANVSIVAFSTSPSIFPLPQSSPRNSSIGIANLVWSGLVDNCVKSVQRESEC